MTKQYIFENDIEEFALYGYDGFSTNKFADKIKINKATLYYHFKDKKSLYQEVLITLLKETTEHIDEIINMKIDPVEKLKKYIIVYIQSIEKMPQIVPIGLREMANLGVDIDDIFISEINKDIRQLEKIVFELPLKDEYKNIDVYEIKALISGTVKTYYAMQMSDISLQNMKSLDKDRNKILNKIGDFISTILINTLCKQ